ncbi:hypothetical protein DFH08DRAFT_1074347 [Mycena albidolilacea]|uniref:Uncharacterized protein n=1 Tax=Mycena albidolilacea TaxID=1033008 RepID=A0AAD7F0B3_9AGAR|nr:hypothetical protein DFH08DRAFT_1074347 [Mycena albidolilacea]
MRITHLLSTTLLALLSCAGNNIVRYVVLLFLVFYAGVFIVQPLLPSARMLKLENIAAETADILQSANEEHMLSNREFNLEVRLRLSRVNLTKSTLRAKLLEFELGHPAKEYLHIAGGLSADIERCKREVKQIQIDILTAMESERQVLYNTNIEEMVVVLSSGSTLRRIH